MVACRGFGGAEAGTICLTQRSVPYIVAMGLLSRFYGSMSRFRPGRPEMQRSLPEAELPSSDRDAAMKRLAEAEAAEKKNDE